MFVQQWPLTFCRSLINQEKECKKPAQKGSWTIHGIWPSLTNSNLAGQPSCCDSRNNLDARGLQPIMEELTRYWPSGIQGIPLNVHNLSKNGLTTPFFDTTDSSDQGFWEYEWMKHGTCSVSVDGLGSSTSYFTRALHWLAEYNMTSILARSNIVPDNQMTYKLLDINTAIKSVLNKNPLINCYYDKKTGEQFLNEIRLCFDRQLSLMDCDGTSKKVNNINTNCLNKPINYRTYGPDSTSEPSGWLTYVGCFVFIVFVVVAGFLMKESNRQKLFRNSEVTRLFNR